MNRRGLAASLLDCLGRSKVVAWEEASGTRLACKATYYQSS